MNAKIKFINIIMIITLLLLVITGCSTTDDKKTNYSQDNTNNKINIITTLYPYYDFSKIIGGEKVEVYLILPPGTEAHTYEPKPSDIIKINEADIFIYNGANMDAWVNDILEGLNNKELIIIDASTYVDLIKTEEHEADNAEKEDDNIDYDPHIWLSFKNDIKIVNGIKDALIKKDNTNSAFYNSNTIEYNKKLEILDEEYTSTIKSCNKKTFLTSGHNAYAYLAKSYNLTYIALYSISADSEPTPSKVAEIVNTAKEENISYLLIEEKMNQKLSNAISEEINITPIIFNPGHNLLKEEFDNNITFIELMDENLKTLKIVLECDN